MTDHEDSTVDDRPEPKYVADEAGRSWLEALQHARMRTERQRDVQAQMHEAWGLRDEPRADD
jgi:hypothetical protein